MTAKPLTSVDLSSRKSSGDKIVMVTAYDATFASILDGAGADILLVGDSLGMVIQGHANTLPVTLEHMIYHTSAVARAARRAQVVADMPFMSYQISAEQAVTSAGRLVQEGGAHAVKLEGGESAAESVERIVRAGIPVMGHIGLTPQSVHTLGGFKVQGREAAAARRLLADARALEQAGCYSLVLEGIPAELAAEITAALHIPTIGIGAGAGCDGQVLVCYDLLGMNPAFKPKFLKTYASLHEQITAAMERFADEVRRGVFPDEKHSFHSKTLRLVGGEEPRDDREKTYGVPV
jgi:3-methyl-2-oxobutanoate hydroxymethyltransferase